MRVKKHALIAATLFMVFLFVQAGDLKGEETLGPIIKKIKSLFGKDKQKKEDKQQKDSFSIFKIEPGVKEDTVLIHFTDTVNISDLRGNMKFLPPVPIRWYDSNISENNVLVLNGKFRRGQKYFVMFSSDFKSGNKKSYVKGITSFIMPNYPPLIAFLDKGSVIERDSRQMLHVQLMNVDEVMFQGLRIPPYMVSIASDEIRSAPNISWNELKNKIEKTSSKIDGVLSKDKDFNVFRGLIVEDRQLFFAQKEQNIFQQFSIPLSFRQDKEKGAIEVVQIQSNKKEQPAETQLGIFRITDIGLSYKLSDSSLLIWTTSINSGVPLKNVSLFAITHSDEAVFVGDTDKTGLFLLKDTLSLKHLNLKKQDAKITTKPISVNQIKMIIAIASNDQSYVNISPEGNLKTEGITQDFYKKKKVAKKAEKKNITQASSQPVTVGALKGHIFTERGIYRPGETIYFKGTVRQYEDGNIQPPSGITATFKIINSKKEEIYKKDIKLSEFGTASDKFSLKSFFPLGAYELQMNYGSNESEVARITFEVQEFRQPRHYVEITYKRETKKDDDYINLDFKKEILNCEISGKYFAGGPVKHGRVRWNIYNTNSDYPRSDYPGYTFGYPLESKTELLESGESMLDANGKITVPILLTKDLLSGKYGVEVVASVVDFDGRASSESTVYQSSPDYFVGISNHQKTVNPGDSQTLYAIVIDKSGDTMSKGNMTVQVMEEGWTYIQKRNADGQLYHERQRIWRKQVSADLPMKDDRASFEFDFSRGGDYLVSFSYKAPDGKQYTSGTLYSVSGSRYYYEDYDARGPKSAQERLSMSSEKSLYVPGEVIKLYLSPHRPISTCLITIERDDLIEYMTYQLKPGQKMIEIPVKNNYGPNVYISVLGTVPRTAFPLYSTQFDTDSPGFLFGTINVEVKSEQQKIKLSVNEEHKKLKALPGSEMTLDIFAADQQGKGLLAELAIGVVDESILAMTGFKTPSLDILGKFILPLSVLTGDLRTDMLKQTPFSFFRNVPLTGGDGDEKGGSFTSKIRKDFNPVAYFNPSVITDANGKARVSFKLPDTMTTYRIYVIACDKGSRFGSYSRSALVVKDFYLEPGLPAFLTKGDKLKFSVSAFNKTENEAPVEFSLKSEEHLLLKTLSTAFPLSGFDRKLIPVEGTVTKSGIAQVLFSGKFKELTDAVEIKIPVNSGYVLGTDQKFGNFKGEVEVKYTFPKVYKDIRWDDIGLDEAKFILTVSGSPFIRMTQALQYLLRYPYGCVEQTSSGVLPLAALRDIIQKGLIPNITISETDKFIKPGIERLFSMQTSSGGFGYWPGDQTPNKWGTIYALNAITRAKLSGFEVPEDRLLKALSYIEEQIKASGKDESTFRGFGAYILALNARLQTDTFNRVFDSINNQPREAAMLTLMSAKISRLMPDDKIKSILKDILEKPWSAGKFSDDFHAVYREPAISLMAANLLFPKQEITDKAAAKLLGGMNYEGIWTSTSDTGWSLTALSEYFRGSGTASTNTVNISVRQGNKIIESFDMNTVNFRTVSFNPKDFVKNPSFSISSNSDQVLLYNLSLTFPRPDYAKKGYSNGFEIHKTIKNTDGSNTIRVGDIVEVKVKFSIKKQGASYVVLDDPLPAGFVAINSAIKTEEQLMGKTKKSRVGSEDDSGGVDDLEDESGEGFNWADYYWDPVGYYKFAPNFFELRKDRVLAFRNHTWTGTYEYSYYARAVCEGEFVMPSTKIQLMYDPEVVAYTPQGKVVIKGR